MGKDKYGQGQDSGEAFVRGSKNSIIKISNSLMQCFFKKKLM